MKFNQILALAALAVIASGSAMAATPMAKPAHGDMFAKMDTNNDGFVSKEEFDAHHGKKFDMMDTNKDGKISKDEMDAAKAAWKAKKADKMAPAAAVKSTTTSTTTTK